MQRVPAPGGGRKERGRRGGEDKGREGRNGKAEKEYIPCHVHVTVLTDHLML